MRHIALALALSACGAATATTRQVVGPDGSKNWFHISCPDDTGLCLQAAGDRCPHGYALASSETHDDVTAKGYANSSFAVYRSEVNRSHEMLIRCNGESNPCPEVDADCRTSPPRPFHCDEQEAARRAAHCD